MTHANHFRAWAPKQPRSGLLRPDAPGGIRHRIPGSIDRIRNLLLPRLRILQLPRGRIRKALDSAWNHSAVEPVQPERDTFCRPVEPYGVLSSHTDLPVDSHLVRPALVYVPPPGDGRSWDASAASEPDKKRKGRQSGRVFFRLQRIANQPSLLASPLRGIWLGPLGGPRKPLGNGVEMQEEARPRGADHHGSTADGQP